MKVETTEHFDIPFFTKLEETITESPLNTPTLVNSHIKDKKLGATDLAPLVKYAGWLMCLFQPKTDSKESVNAFKELACAAINTKCTEEDEENAATRRMRNNSLPKNYIEDHPMIFDREVYQKTKDTLLWGCESQYLEKARRYLPSMLPHLYECDFDEIFRWLREAKQISRRWQYSWIVKYALNNDKVPEQHLDWALSSLSFSTLSESARAQHAKKALELMPWNYKHLSQCDRVTYADCIDLLSTPMLVAFHPKRDSLSADEWKELLEADLRALRFAPSHIVKDKQAFDDEYLLGLLKKNNVGYFLRAKYKLVSFINELAPERLSVEFCEKIQAGGFAEQHHLVVVTKLKTKKKTR